MDDTVETLNGYIQQGQFHQVATANINFLMNAVRDRRLMEILQTCSLVVADGVPLIWASRLMRCPLRERVAGYNLVPRLAGLAAEKGYGIYLLGASEQSSAGAAAWIQANYPGARITGRYSPPVSELEAMDHDLMLRLIEQAKPDILLVAFGNPKQEKWIALHRSRLSVPVVIGVGGSMDFLAGKVKYAPRWMQKTGLEAIYRVGQEPRRLGKRYFLDFIRACRYLPPQIVAVRFQARGQRQQQLLCFEQDGGTVLRPEGRFTGALVEKFETAAEKVRSRNRTLILDLSAATVLGADALGAMVKLKADGFPDGAAFLLTGVSRSARRILAKSFLLSHFQTSLKHRNPCPY